MNKQTPNQIMIIKSQAQFCFPITQLQNKSIFSTYKFPIFIASAGNHGTPQTAVRGSVAGAPPGQLWARGRSPYQVRRDQNQPQPTGIYLGTCREPPLAEAPGNGSRGVTTAKVPASTTPYCHQCPRSCKASANFSTRFVRVQTARLTLLVCCFTQWWIFHIVSCSVGLEYWELPCPSRTNHFTLTQAQILSPSIPTKLYWPSREWSR